MAYTDSEAILTYINNQDLIPFTQDDASGMADDTRLAAIIATVSTKIDGYLANRYTVPFSPVPPLIKNCATMFACEAFWARRLTPDQKNPFTAECNDLRDLLKDIHDGKASVDATVAQAFASVQYTSGCVVMNATSM